MLLFEYDAKELLAVQGIPVPGGIRLDHAPSHAASSSDESSGPWIVKPQILGGAATLARHIAAVRTNAEIRAATESLLGRIIDGQAVHSVLVERQFTPRGLAFLRFECDPPSAGIRITTNVLTAAAPEGDLNDAAPPATVVAPDPSAVIIGVDTLAARLPADVRASISEAGRMLAPLFFGYEAALLEIAPLMLLSDGGWAVGDVRLAIDENALFRHPELLSLIERRDYAYRDVRQRRRYGLDYRIIDPAGSVATITSGTCYGAFLVDEMKVRGLSPYNIVDAGAVALNNPDEALDHLQELFTGVASLRCIFLCLAGDFVELPAVAERFAVALRTHPALTLPIVARFVGAGAGAAGAILEKAAPNVDVEPTLDAALDLVAAHAEGRPA